MVENTRLKEKRTARITAPRAARIKAPQKARELRAVRELRALRALLEMQEQQKSQEQRTQQAQRQEPADQPEPQAQQQQAQQAAQAAQGQTAAAQAAKAQKAPKASKAQKAQKAQKAPRAAQAAPVPVWKDMLFLLMKITAIALSFILLTTFLFGVMRYEDPSMDPAIKDGDLVIFHRYTKDGYEPRDVVALELNGKRQATRVIAVSGDMVDITEDGLVINGALQQEQDIFRKTERYQDGIDFPLTVPEGHIFVLGDSRVGATDSRIYGSVKIEDTLGKVMAVIRRRSI